MAGMSESEIKKLCNSRSFKGFKAPPFWTAEIYGLGYIIREYGYYPKFLPLCINTDHGPATLDYPIKLELDSYAPCQFYHSHYLVKKWKKLSKKACYVLYSPFVFFRKKNNIVALPNAKGTIAFPAHTTRTVEDKSDVEVYIKQLLDLPKEFQPVSVCLYYDDIKKGKHKIFQKYKIPIYTAGFYFDQRFTERFYNILKNFKYATSNVLGSYLYYAVEMGIPFSIYGNREEIVNAGDPNLPPGKYELYQSSTRNQKILTLFKGLNTRVSAQQRSIIEEHLGLYDGVGRKEMSIILYTSFLKWLSPPSLIRWIITIFKNLKILKTGF